MKWVDFFGTIFVIATLSIAIIFAIAAARQEGKNIGIKSMRYEAVAAWHAEYVADEDGSPIWRWKPLPVENK